MSEDEVEYARWMCGRGSMVNLHRVSAIVRDMRDPCLNHSPSKGHKMLKPEKWQAVFDSDGKVIGFQKALKLIILGGVDPSIRGEVWEFLLGCYALNSTSEYRSQLRMARRERYQTLVKQCQSIHSSIGTGELAYVVGSRVMDMRTNSKEQSPSPKPGSLNITRSPYRTSTSHNNNSYTATSRAHKRKSYGTSSELPYNDFPNSNFNPYFDNDEPRYDEPKYDEPRYDKDDLYGFDSLPAANLFWDNHEGDEEKMHSFEINNNIDLVMEADSKIENERWVDKVAAGYNSGKVGDVFGEPISNDFGSDGDRVSEWLWTLHRIVVDVVRTDNHLQFYEDSRNMARMSDILAVYAWVDPSTGYCQGMSDLLSPFVVLYEDNADAFWCFEMLLRRLRENFQMEGPTGVMRQLQALWRITELTDIELFEHLSVIGAENLHFAFRMLLVLFRRELSFDEALCMWEMMWAADFDEELTRDLDKNCLEALTIDLSTPNMTPTETIIRKPKHRRRPLNKNGENSRSMNKSGIMTYSAKNPLCGLSRASRNFWISKHEQELDTMEKAGDDELAVFCVAAILITNRHKIMRETKSIDDVIKMFNDNVLKINVKRCIHMAMKLRKKYLYKLMKQTNAGSYSDQ
ncbi:Ypt/Rab-GAP domain of gyp1p superfamily protein [Rhynchospora pubera]|uniref:Ypt/Rab-GAP domain of gyp1p superfamily protein n=1 Tax=Rhynchospora pubera TaxID=906938 RepID=A0AAV8C3P7_9POAL|nr:Ypt/Rab-GAP domain of gyp1p superfamily protein [Rhynchospora pubera]